MENKTDKKEKLVIDGNAFYEIDLECLRQKKMDQQKQQEQTRRQKGQRS